MGLVGLESKYLTGNGRSSTSFKEKKYRKGNKERMGIIVENPKHVINSYEII